MICEFVFKFSLKLELLAAKNLVGANLNGTSDPYAIITCGNEKRFRFADLVISLFYLNLSVQKSMGKRKIVS